MHIRPAIPSDLSTTSTVAASALWDDELYEWLHIHRDQFPEHFRNSILQKHRRRYWRADFAFYVVETDEKDKDWSGKPQVVGYAIWQRNGDSGAAKAWRKGKWWARASYIYLVSIRVVGIDKRLEFLGLETVLLDCESWYHHLLKTDKSVDYARLKHFHASSPDDFDDISDFWNLRDLGTDPAFQRRGVAGMLLEWGQSQAARERCPVGLTA
ncbi:MAG: hypothetical protein Q9191_007528, partial [Dirinaria sp. TL-2023a]